MKKLAIAATFVPGTALAHPGHYAEAAGHTHWIALGALALAGMATAVAVARTILTRRSRSRDKAARDSV